MIRRLISFALGVSIAWVGIGFAHAQTGILRLRHFTASDFMPAWGAGQTQQLSSHSSLENRITGTADSDPNPGNSLLTYSWRFRLDRSEEPPALLRINRWNENPTEEQWGELPEGSRYSEILAAHGRLWIYVCRGTAWNLYQSSLEEDSAHWRPVDSEPETDVQIFSLNSNADPHLIRIEDSTWIVKEGVFTGGGASLKWDSPRKIIPLEAERLIRESKQSMPELMGEFNTNQPAILLSFSWKDEREESLIVRYRISPDSSQAYGPWSEPLAVQTIQINERGQYFQYQIASGKDTSVDKSHPDLELTYTFDPPESAVSGEIKERNTGSGGSSGGGSGLGLGFGDLIFSPASTTGGVGAVQAGSSLGSAMSALSAQSQAGHSSSQTGSSASKSANKSQKSPDKSSLISSQKSNPEDRENQNRIKSEPMQFDPGKKQNSPDEENPPEEKPADDSDTPKENDVKPTSEMEAPVSDPSQPDSSPESNPDTDPNSPDSQDDPKQPEADSNGDPSQPVGSGSAKPSSVPNTSPHEKGDSIALPQTSGDRPSDREPSESDGAGSGGTGGSNNAGSTGNGKGGGKNNGKGQPSSAGGGMNPTPKPENPDPENSQETNSIPQSPSSNSPDSKENDPDSEREKKPLPEKEDEKKEPEDTQNPGDTDNMDGIQNPTDELPHENPGFPNAGNGGLGNSGAGGGGSSGGGFSPPSKKEDDSSGTSLPDSEEDTSNPNGGDMGEGRPILSSGNAMGISPRVSFATRAEIESASLALALTPIEWEEKERSHLWWLLMLAVLIGGSVYYGRRRENRAPSQFVADEDWREGWIEEIGGKSISKSDVWEHALYFHPDVVSAGLCGNSLLMMKEGQTICRAPLTALLEIRSGMNPLPLEWMARLSHPLEEAHAVKRGNSLILLGRDARGHDRSVKIALPAGERAVKGKRIAGPEELQSIQQVQAIGGMLWAAGESGTGRRVFSAALSGFRTGWNEERPPILEKGELVALSSGEEPLIAGIPEDDPNHLWVFQQDRERAGRWRAIAKTPCNSGQALIHAAEKRCVIAEPLRDGRSIRIFLFPRDEQGRFSARASNTVLLPHSGEFFGLEVVDGHLFLLGRESSRDGTAGPFLMLEAHVGELLKGHNSLAA